MNYYSKISQIRLRRNRRFSWIRDMIAETSLSVGDLIWPVFVMEGSSIKEPINDFPGVYRYSIDMLAIEVQRAYDLGINSIMLFPYIDSNLKNSEGKEAFNQDNLICRSINHLKNKTNIGIICDVALDPYTDHGHDGVVIDGYVANDETVEALCRQAVIIADSGADFVSPSDMMDGRVGAIRSTLDKNKFINTGIISYAAKYASSFYGPFRSAVGSKIMLNKSDKRTYQMDPRNIKEAIREVEQDIQEGADMVIIKPAMPYLDVIKNIADNFTIPILSYQVSGEYVMIKLAAERNMLIWEDAIIESLICCKRAGSNAIITYAALDAAKIL